MGSGARVGHWHRAPVPQMAVGEAGRFMEYVVTRVGWRGRAGMGVVSSLLAFLASAEKPWKGGAAHGVAPPDAY